MAGRFPARTVTGGGALQGKRMRGLWDTFGCARLVGRWPEAASPRRSKADGGGVPLRRRFGRGKGGRPGSEASVGRGGAIGGVRTGNAGSGTGRPQGDLARR